MQVKTKLKYSQLLTIPFALALCSCELDKPAVGYAYFPDVFRGMLVADEPQTLEVGREMLRSGGNAYDAALAMSFAYMVAYPSRVSVFSSGECLYYDATDKEANKISFKSDDNGNIVPQLPRALYKLYAQKGTKKFPEIIAPAENMANFGFNISKELYLDISRSSKDISKLLVSDEYNIGAMAKSPDLGKLLSAFRSSGVGVLYNGALLNNYVNEAGALSMEKKTISSYIPQVTEVSITHEIGNDVTYLSSIKGRLNGKDASLMVADKDGNAVACQFSNGELFGDGKYLSSIGSFIAKNSKESSNKVGIRVNKYVKTFREIKLGDNQIICDEGLPEYPDTCAINAINYSRFEGTPPERKKLIFRKDQNKYENL